MIDCHAHLELCAPGDLDRQAQLVALASEVGVERILTVGIDSRTCRAALAAAEAFPQVYAAIGRHPNEATGFDDGDLAELRALASHPRCLAIGETGLDLYRQGADLADQRRAFLAQIELARELGKPLVIHSRAAERETVDLLAAHAEGVKVILHCFTLVEELDRCLEHGWWISFAGNLTYPSARQLVEAAKRVPLNRLLVETDAPFLAPQPHRGRENQPAYVVETARFLAELTGIGYERFNALMDRNWDELFGLAADRLAG